MKSEKECAVFNDWAIELFDGALQIQREFKFACEDHCSAFIKSIGAFVKCPNMSVSTARGSSPKPWTLISIEILPERSLLAAAGEIAAICEREYSSIAPLEVESAA